MDSSAQSVAQAAAGIDTRELALESLDQLQSQARQLKRLQGAARRECVANITDYIDACLYFFTENNAVETVNCTRRLQTLLPNLPSANGFFLTRFQQILNEYEIFARQQILTSGMHEGNNIVFCGLMQKLTNAFKDLGIEEPSIETDENLLEYQITSKLIHIRVNHIPETNQCYRLILTLNEIRNKAPNDVDWVIDLSKVEMLPPEFFQCLANIKQILKRQGNQMHLTGLHPRRLSADVRRILLDKFFVRQTEQPGISQP